MEKIFSSFLHLTCPECGRQILTNFTRPQASRLCLRCGTTIHVPRERRSRFRDLELVPAPARFENCLQQS